MVLFELMFLVFLRSLAKGTRARLQETPEQAAERLEKMRAAVRTILECVGEDPDREGLLDTPSRYAKAMLFFTKGYQVNVDDLVNNALFNEGHNEMIVVKDIEVNSLCEHHLVPFTGKVFLLLFFLSSLRSTWAGKVQRCFRNSRFARRGLAKYCLAS